MKHLFRLTKTITLDLTRFLDRHYLTAKAADFLHRSLRRRMSQALLAAAAAFAGTKLYPLQQAAPTAAIAFAFGLFAWVLQMWATRILSGRLAYARSHGIFLLKDRKKTALLTDLPRLWRRVYAPDLPILFPDSEERQRLRNTIRDLERSARGSCPESRRFDFGLQLSHHRSGISLLSARAFHAAVQYELLTSHPQNTQDARLGFSLTLLENALDATVFGSEGDSSFERHTAQISMAQAHTLLLAQHALPRRLIRIATGSLRRHFQAFWRRNIALALEARAGALLHRLHRRYDTTRIDVQDLLWQDPEALLALTLATDTAGGAEPLTRILRNETAQAAKQVFSNDRSAVRRIVSRMHGYDLVQATLLLAAADPNCALACGNGINATSSRHEARDPRLDLDLADAHRTDYETLQTLHRQARNAERTWPELAALPHVNNLLRTPETARALRIAWHTDDHGLRSNVENRRLHGQALHETLEILAKQAPQTTEHLRALRLARELAHWQLTYTLNHALTLCNF